MYTVVTNTVFESIVRPGMEPVAGSEAWTLVVVQTSAREAAFTIVADTVAVRASAECIVRYGE